MTASAFPISSVAGAVRRASIRAALLAAALLVSCGCAVFPHGAYWPAHDPALRGRSLAPAVSDAADDAEAPVLGADPKARLDRLQANVTSRWEDEDLAESARRMDGWAGRWAYAEAMRTVAWFYVEPVTYRELVLAGLWNLRAALENPRFAERFPETENVAKREAFDAAVADLIDEVRGARPWSEYHAAGWLGRAMDRNRETLGLPDGAVVAEFLFGAVDGLDPYTRYLTPEMQRASREHYEGTYAGVGVSVRVRDGRVVVEEVFEGGAAAEAGLKAGDEIVGVDGRAVGEMALGEVATTMRGRPGTTVVVSVRSGGEGEPRDVELVRKQIHLPVVRDEQVLDPAEGVAYLRLTSFRPGSARQFRRALRRLREAGAESLVLDLRSNPGGSLLATIDVAGMLLERGRVARTRGRMIGASWAYDVAPLARQEWTGPLVVLVDEETASAAEILAACLAHHGRATVVGRRTFGKGAVQMELPTGLGGGALSLTIARVYDPDGECLEGRGVAPDVAVARQDPPPVSLEEDAAVRAALDHLGGETGAGS